MLNTYSKIPEKTQRSVSVLLPKYPFDKGPGRLLVTALALAFLTFSTAPTIADEAPQRWVPAVLELPLDSEVTSDRAIGSNIRMFSFTTQEDPDTLLADWEAALKLGGYTIRRSIDASIISAVEFSGQGIVNAKISVAPSRSDNRSTIEFDATLQR